MNILTIYCRKNIPWFGLKPSLMLFLLNLSCIRRSYRDWIVPSSQRDYTKGRHPKPEPSNLGVPFSSNFCRGMNLWPTEWNEHPSFDYLWCDFGLLFEFLWCFLHFLETPPNLSTSKQEMSNKDKRYFLLQSPLFAISMLSRGADNLKMRMYPKISKIIYIYIIYINLYISYTKIRIYNTAYCDDFSYLQLSPLRFFKPPFYHWCCPSSRF